MDPGEPHWQTNSSFSPPPFRIWDCRLQSDGYQHGSGAPLRGSSLSSNSRGSRSRVGSERYTNHHHSVSDGVLSYSGSPTDNIQAPRWTSPVQKFNLGELAASTAGGRLLNGIHRREMVFLAWVATSGVSRSCLDLPSKISVIVELKKAVLASYLLDLVRCQHLMFEVQRHYAVRGTAASPSLGSPSSLSESSRWESTSKRPFSVPNRNLPSRRSYMSKAVYPVVFHNPVSDCETFGDADTNSVGRLTPSEDHVSPSHWLDNSSSIVQKFHKTLTELQRWEASPEPGASSRRDGFRWSSASSYDLGFDGERFDISDHIDAENLRSPTGPAADLKCGVCGKFLCQKSPWSSHRIMRGSDMPTAGVLPCSHVFHAECLEQLTPKTQIHEPPCPMCLKTITAVEESLSVSEPLHMALRSVQRNRGIVISDSQGSHGNNEASNHVKNRLTRNWSGAAAQSNDNSSSIKNRLKRHFTFKGKASKDLFNTKVFHRIGSASSSKEPVQRQSSLG
ncbi:hypothetical protein EZV62_007554 [Acer yangbiense]|uniref:RING-type domain-containing protein n=1 Tax=Acer yangbiense TaxID=1000413 RepID=A0A5C7IBW8_9ROSI|nr:hypothetical protein EZV62_007554 [Acer yangbiense]